MSEVILLCFALFERSLSGCTIPSFQGDHLTLLNVFEEWKRNEMSVEWSQQNFIQQKHLERALDIRNQLLNIMNTHGVPVVSCLGR